MAKKYYAGIGSRKTPEHILTMMEDIAEHLAIKGYVLRSGGADGADSAFEIGCDRANGEREIYLPWKNFNNKDSIYVLDQSPFKEESFAIAEKFHPKWIYLKPAVKKLMGRNSYQILGEDLKTPSKFIVCYCEEDLLGNFSGGTGQALRIAQENNIKIYNLFKEEVIDTIQEKIK